MEQPRTFILAFFLLSIIAGCTNKQQTDTRLEQEKVRRVFTDFIAAIEAGDTDGYFSYLTDDFIGYDAGRKPIHIGNEFRDEMEAFFTANTFNLTNHESQEVIVQNDIAIHRHAGTITIKPKTDTTSIVFDVKYLDILKKDESGNWKIYMHTVSPNQ